MESAFQKVNDFGLKTVALPVMGCGKMLQYPPQIAVTVTVDAAVKAAKETKKGIKVGILTLTKHNRSSIYVYFITWCVCSQ